jgi:hypothetical protein
MSDWQVGDLALCVDARPNPFYGKSGLTEGVIYKVVGAVFNPAPHALYGEEAWGLFLAEISAEAPEGFAASRFRKIRPDEHEACEPEFITLLKRTKTPALEGS